MVIIQFGKVKKFQDKVYVQNCIDCTRIIYNDQCSEEVELKNRMCLSLESPSQGLSQLTDFSKHSNEDEFLQLTPRNIIQSLKDCKGEMSFIVLGTVKHIVDDDDWWYTACICSKAVYPDSKMFFCEKCNKHVMKVTPRYKLKVRVMDDTDSTTFVIFDRDATLLLKKPYAGGCFA